MGGIDEPEYALVINDWQLGACCPHCQAWISVHSFVRDNVLPVGWCGTYECVKCSKHFQVFINPSHTATPVDV